MKRTARKYPQRPPDWMDRLWLLFNVACVALLLWAALKVAAAMVAGQPMITWAF